MYELRKTRIFEECVRKYPEYRERITKTIEKICTHPYHHSHLLEKRGNIDLRGKRSRVVGNGKNFIIVFMVCEECIRNCWKGVLNNCECCDDIEDEKTVILLAFGKHERAYRKNW